MCDAYCTHILAPPSVGRRSLTCVRCFVPGGHREFHRKHKELCEDALVSGLSRGLSASASCPALADVDSYPASKLLPFLYLGNSKDAADLSCLKGLGTTCVLNVTSQLPGYHEECGITYKQIPATDSGHQNLKQYFEEAFEFIGELPVLLRLLWLCRLTACLNNF